MQYKWTHKPILVKEIADLLLTDKKGLYLDGTLGLGGHTKYFLNLLDKEAKIIGFDKDVNALEMAKNNVADNRLIPIHASYLDAPKELEGLGLLGQVQGALFDLGLSSYQLDDASRGFSFMKEGPLDMRFDNTKGKTASDIINTYPADELEKIFYNYGEERASTKIALAICSARREKPINDTLTLTRIIESCLSRFGKTHPATKIFQALRIAVNDELNVVFEAPKMLPSLIKVGGRVAFITFHSIEDRIIKQAFKQLVASNCWQLVNKKIIVPSIEEVKDNSRARSASLRVIERIK